MNTESGAPTVGGGARDQTTQTTIESPKQGGETAADTAGPGGPQTGTNKPLDPSANANPNDPKQRARASGLLGNTDQFDDSPIDDKTSPNRKGQKQPLTTQPQAQVALQLDTPDAAVKKALDAQRSAITGCHKAATGVLEIAITVDASGKVTTAKVAASSTLKDAATSDCVLALVKKLQLGKGAKVTAPIRITF